MAVSTNCNFIQLGIKLVLVIIIIIKHVTRRVILSSGSRLAQLSLVLIDTVGPNDK